MHTIIHTYKFFLCVYLCVCIHGSNALQIIQTVQALSLQQTILVITFHARHDLLYSVTVNCLELWNEMRVTSLVRSLSVFCFACCKFLIQHLFSCLSLTFPQFFHLWMRQALRKMLLWDIGVATSKKGGKPPPFLQTQD